MSVLDFFLLLLIAGICGAIGQALAGTARGGCLTSIALGFVGALIGMWVARMLSLPPLFEVRLGDENATAFPIIWSILGAALFMAILSLLTRPRGP